MVAVAGPLGSASSGTQSRVAGSGSVKLASGSNGRRRSVRYAEIARANPWVVSAVGGRAGPASRVPIHTNLPDPEGREGHRLRVRPGDGGVASGLARLMVNPAPRMSGRKLWRKTHGDKLTHGNALIEKVRSGANVVGLQLQPWAHLEPVLSDDGLELLAVKVPVRRHDGYAGRLTYGEMRVIDADDFIHLTMNDDTEGPLGVSPLASLHHTHALHDAALRFAVAYMDNGVFPSGMVEMDKGTTPELLEATRILIQSLFAGPDNAGQPFVAPGKWQQIMATPEGARLVELAQLSHEEVGAAYRTPLSQLGDTRDTNKATADTDRTRFMRDVVGEDVSTLETELNAQLVQTNRRYVTAGVWVEAQMGELLRPDLEKLAEVVYRQVQGPVATANDGRRLLGLPPLEDPAADRLILNPGTPGPESAADEPDDDEDPDDAGSSSGT